MHRRTGAAAVDIPMSLRERAFTLLTLRSSICSGSTRRWMPPRSTIDFTRCCRFLVDARLHTLYLLPSHRDCTRSTFLIEQAFNRAPSFVCADGGQAGAASRMA